MFVTFEGQGFDERHSEPIQVKDGCITMPSTQKIPVPGQVREDMCYSLGCVDHDVFVWNSNMCLCVGGVPFRGEGVFR